jgi:hypothetical protein
MYPYNIIFEFPKNMYRQQQSWPITNAMYLDFLKDR